MTVDPRVEQGFPAQLQVRRGLLEGGAHHLGWKVGFGAPAALETMQLTAPLVGFLTDETLFPSGGHIDVSGWVRPVIEFEVFVALGRDLGAGASPAAAARAVGAVGAAIEVADVDIDPLGPAAVPDILAGDIFHRGVVLGRPDAGREGLDLDGLIARVEVNGDPRPPVVDLEALTGPLPWVVTVVADTLDAFGEPLKAGDVIITGSVIPPVPLEHGGVHRYRLGGLPEIELTT